MSAAVIDGRAVAEAMREQVRAQAEALHGQGVSPKLVVSLVGEDAASRSYARNLERAGQRVGVNVAIDVLGDATSEAELRKRIAVHAQDPRVHGIVLAQPLPAHLTIARIGDAIPLDKDVDGTNPQTLGLLALGVGAFVPATAAAILLLLERSPAWPLAGKRVLVIGRSRVVGLPAALLLLAQHATVTIAHSRTRELARAIRDAEVIVVAAGVPGLVRGDAVSAGAVVIDAGTNVVEGGVVGDVDFAGVSAVAAAVTPVPGGVGPVTNVMLMRNVVRAAEHARALSSS